MPGRLRVDDFFAYLRPCYADWDRDLEDELRAQWPCRPDRKIGELSHGMRLKMALACALPFRPKLLVLDEPLSGLDALARDEIIAGFMRQAGGTTILISSHELDEVERFATHVAFLHDGRLLFQGSMGALAEHARPLIGGGRKRSERPSLRDIFVAMVRAARREPETNLRRNRIDQPHLEEGLEAVVADGRLGHGHSDRPRMGGIQSGLFRDLPAAEALQRPLNMAWFIGIAALAAAVVHQDPIPGVDQDWLIRPLHRTQLLLAKLAFLAITISVPMAALNLADALAIGMPLALIARSGPFQGAVHLCVLHRTGGGARFRDAQYDGADRLRGGSGIGILVEPQPQCFFPRHRLVSDLPHGDGVAPAPRCSTPASWRVQSSFFVWIIIGVDSGGARTCPDRCGMPRLRAASVERCFRR